MSHTTKVEVFCPHCREALVVQLTRPVDTEVATVIPRYDRTIENRHHD